MSKTFSMLALLALLVSAFNAPAMACGSGQDCTDGTDQPVMECSDQNCE